jgi:hypothetical protein
LPLMRTATALPEIIDCLSLFDSTLSIIMHPMFFAD